MGGVGGYCVLKSLGNKNVFSCIVTLCSLLVECISFKHS